MVISKIELCNFRIYQGLNTIELKPERDKNIFIVSGKNGFGKTTFLMSLVWCLYGRQMTDVDDIYEKEIKEQGGYGTYIKSSLNRQANSKGDTSFHVAVTITGSVIPELPAKEIVIKRSYSTIKGIDTIEILVDGEEKDLIKELGDANLTGEEMFIREFIMPIEIAKFFLFDAEKIVNLAENSSPEQRKKLSLAYSEILGIKKYEDIKDEMETLRDRLKQSSANPKDKQLLNTLKAEVENILVEIESDNKEIALLKEKRAQLAYEAEQLRDKLIRAGNTVTEEEYQALKKEVKDCSDALELLQNDFRDSFEKIPFVIAGGRMLEVVEQVADETNYKSALQGQEKVEQRTDQVLTDLLSAERTLKEVVPASVHRFYHDTVKDLIKRHFFAETPDLPDDFKLLHDFSSSETQQLNGFLAELKQDFRASFRTLNERRTQFQNQLTAAKKRLAAADSNQEDPVLAADRLKRDDLNLRVVKIDDQIAEYYKSIGKCDDRKANAEKQISEITKKIKVGEEHRGKYEESEKLIAELQQFITRFKTDKKKSLETQILQGLTQLMHKKDFISRVDVNIYGEDIEIDLYNASDLKIRKDSLSKGEQQMYATALLRGLVEESQIEFPVFIDSPMQKFDEQHAENIIRFFYPSIADQVILFPLINKELTKREYKLLLPRVAQAYLIHNVHPDKSEFRACSPETLIETYTDLYTINAD
ncbi:DNA sulfur modification protein DndD [Spirosoma luteolum]